LQARKRELRRLARAAVPLDPTGERSAAIAERVRALPAYGSARTIALYAALPGEVATAALLDELWRGDVAVALPRIEGDGLRLYPIRGEEQLQPGRYGVREPRAGAALLAAGDVDVFLVPALYFDRAGQRLGRGGGCYDRLLAAARAGAVRVG